MSNTDESTPVAWHMHVIGCDGSADWCELGAKKPAPAHGVEALPLGYLQPAAPAAPSPLSERDMLRLISSATTRANEFSDDGPARQPAALVEPALPPGWQFVPVEPTPEMLAAVGRCTFPDGQAWLDADARATWAAMLAAAPTAQQEPKP